MIHQFLVVSQSYRQVMGRWSKTFRLAKHLRHKSIIEHHEHSCQGLGYIESPKIPSDKSSRVQDIYFQPLQRNWQYIHHFKGSALKVQGQWTKWLSYVPQNVSWKSWLSMPVNLSSLCISSTNDTLPSPVLKDRNLLLRPPVSCVLKIFALHLIFLVHVKLL